MLSRVLDFIGRSGTRKPLLRKLISLPGDFWDLVENHAMTKNIRPTVWVNEIMSLSADIPFNRWEHSHVNYRINCRRGFAQVLFTVENQKIINKMLKEQRLPMVQIIQLAYWTGLTVFTSKQLERVAGEKAEYSTSESDS